MIWLLALKRNEEVIKIQDVIGVLDRTDMDHFAGIFMAFLKHGKTDDAKGWPHSTLVGS